MTSPTDALLDELFSEYEASAPGGLRPPTALELFAYLELTRWKLRSVEQYPEAAAFYRGELAWIDQTAGEAISEIITPLDRYTQDYARKCAAHVYRFMPRLICNDRGDNGQIVGVYFLTRSGAPVYLVNYDLRPLADQPPISKGDFPAAMLASPNWKFSTEYPFNREARRHR